MKLIREHGHIVGVIILLAIALFFLKTKVLVQVEDTQKPFEEMIGQRIVIDKDTLTIVDFSTLENSLILSNGTKVSTKLATPERIIK